MKKVWLLLIPLFFAGCAQTVNLNRVKGITGEYAPIVEEDSVLFQVYVPEATFVTIAGSFNGWSDWTTPMENDGNGVWSIEMELESGTRYQYKYVIDGFRVADPDNPNTASDGFGGVNSIVDLR